MTFFGQSVQVVEYTPLSSREKLVFAEKSATLIFLAKKEAP